eukprot:m.6176 g.6176  ORF g.6176 m.6176 type:complete len:125 (-) comp4713_c0_seq1:52-426(-)
MFKKSKLRSSTRGLRASHNSLASSGSEGGLPDAAALSRLPIALNLGDYQMVYEDGCWRSENASAGQPNKELALMRKRVQELSEENNMLKFKVEVLLDMLAINKADFQTLQKELDTRPPLASARK